MSEHDDRWIDRRLDQMKTRVVRERRRASRVGRLKRVGSAGRSSSWRHRAAIILGRLAGLCALIVLPFVLLVRGAVSFEMAGAPTIAAVVAGAVLAFLAVTVTAALVSKKFTGRARFGFIGRWIGVPLVAGWLLYALLYVAAVNAKGAAVRAEYRSLHPTMRLALSTAVLADESIVITDMARRAADYEQMGLPPRERSRHFRQSDGWVHAADLRTVGRSPARIGFLTTYFRAMGFTVIRHTGTADHLHVSTRFLLDTSQDQ